MAEPKICRNCIHKDVCETCKKYANKIFDFKCEHFLSADAEEVKHGEWKSVYDGFHDITEIVCSCCYHTGQKHFNYCVYCGAKMDGGKNEQNNRNS